MHTPPEHSAIVDGEALSLDGLYWPRPYYPTRAERAALIAVHIPAWATATSHTSGWIWTGMGSPLPLVVLRPTQPAVSPIERERWKARELRQPAHQTTAIGGHRVLDTSSTEVELLTHSHHIDRAASQIFFLRQEPAHVLAGASLRMSANQRERAHRIMERVLKLQEAYPDITR